MKLAVVNKLRQKYSISAICRVLGINRSIIYYQHQLKEKLLDTGLEDKIKRIFIDNRKAYGTRKSKRLPRAPARSTRFTRRTGEVFSLSSFRLIYLKKLKLLTIESMIFFALIAYISSNLLFVPMLIQGRNKISCTPDSSTPHFLICVYKR